MAREVVLNAQKAESHRLGHEMSEDALSWNVFTALAEAERLGDALQFLTGRAVTVEPDLYLWGERIDVRGRKRGRYHRFESVRTALESDIAHFKTEPDIMLVIEGKLVVCVEAKFGSGNTLAYESRPLPGAKPTDRARLIARYLGDKVSQRTRQTIDQSRLGPTFHSQLFRNVIFASEMAAGAEWHVVNLVSKTQSGLDSDRYSFSSPEGAIREYLHATRRDCFSFRTWEELFRQVVRSVPALARLKAYTESKSAHYVKAFELA